MGPLLLDNRNGSPALTPAGALRTTGAAYGTGRESGRPVIFVSDVPPCLNYSGGLFMGQVMRALGDQLIRAFIVQSRSLRPEIDTTLSEHIELKTVVKPEEGHGVETSGSLNEARIFYAEQQALTRELPGILADLIDFSKDIPDALYWVLLEGQTMIRLAFELMQVTDAPVVVQVMDPPEWWLRAHNVDSASTAEVVTKYRAVLRGAQGVAAASWAMAEEYAGLFGIPANAVVPPLSPALGRAAATEPSDSGPLTIGFSGQIYASTEWDVLVEALADCDWHIAGRPVRIRAYLAPTALAGTVPDHVLDRRPWVPQAQLIEELASCDLLYCPYWFDPLFRNEARLCFPSKLTTYLASGRPVFFHGPRYASPGRFLQETGAGFLCFDLDRQSIRRTLERAFGDRAAYAKVARAGRMAFDRYLTTQHLEESVRGLVAHAGTDTV